MFGQTKTSHLEQTYVERFNTAMRDDFNTPEAMAVLFELIRELNRAVKEEQSDLATTLYSTLRALTDILGLVQHHVDDFLKSTIGHEDSGLSDSEIETLIQQRADAKSQRFCWCRCNS